MDEKKKKTKKPFPKFEDEIIQQGMRGEFLEDGLIFIIPMKGISLNEFKHQHWAITKRYKQLYKAIVDKLMMDMFMIRDTPINMTEDGLRLVAPVFLSNIKITWILGFKTRLIRDVSNYTQKTLLDAIVMTGLFEDDNQNFVIKDSTEFCEPGKNITKCMIQGDINPLYKAYFKKPI